MNIHKTAVLDKSVYLGKNVEIGAFSQILGNVQIGDNVKIKSNCVIGAEADQPRVDRLGGQNGSIVIQDGCVIKDSVIISKPTLTEVTKIGSNSKHTPYRKNSGGRRAGRARGGGGTSHRERKFDHLFRSLFR